MYDDDISRMVGKTMVSVTRLGGFREDDELVFVSEDGLTFRFFHSQDCCESVRIDDVCGDLEDLVGSPILLAEEESNHDETLLEEVDYRPESFTWTFYKFATVKGSVTVRWYGTSNGYYSESVSLTIS